MPAKLARGAAMNAKRTRTKAAKEVKPPSVTSVTILSVRAYPSEGLQEKRREVEALDPSENRGA